jgi:NAD(P)-dependent dehydrogenase (short-subunit alcohol dehydrogenase family)
MKAVALVTGTSSGIGLFTAVQLAQAGFAVVATMRNPAKAEALTREAAAAGVELDVRALDVQDAASVTSCVNGVLGDYGRIDLLVNNAGSGFLGTLEETTFEQLTQVMDVNFYGVWRVTEAVFPHMRRAGSGRIVTNTSIGGLIGQPFNDAYCAAKFAVEGFMESLAPVASRLGIRVSIVEPGPVNTEFVSTVREKLGQAEPTEARAAYATMRESYLAASSQVFAMAQSGADVARVMVEAATAAQPHLRYVTSDLVRTIAGRKYVDLTGDSIVAMTGARLG